MSRVSPRVGTLLAVVLGGGATAAPVGPVGPALLRRVSGFRRASLGVSTAAPLMGA